jgi:hypothetical protein
MQMPYWPAVILVLFGAAVEVYEVYQYLTGTLYLTAWTIFLGVFGFSCIVVGLHYRDGVPQRS